MTESVWGRGEYIRTIVLPTKGMQVVKRGEPHFPQNDRVTDISFPLLHCSVFLDGRRERRTWFPRSTGRYISHRGSSNLSSAPIFAGLTVRSSFLTITLEANALPETCLQSEPTLSSESEIETEAHNGMNPGKSGLRRFGV